MMRTLAVFFLLAVATATQQGETSRANPIRKVVTMLQNMQKKVEAEGEAKKKQLDEDLKQHQADRSAAKAAMAEATALRKKEAAAYAKEASEDSANIAATEKATAAIEQGMGSAFLQTPTAGVVLKIAQKK